MSNVTILTPISNHHTIIIPEFKSSFAYWSMSSWWVHPPPVLLSPFRLWSWADCTTLWRSKAPFWTPTPQAMDARSRAPINIFSESPSPVGQKSRKQPLAPIVLYSAEGGGLGSGTSARFGFHQCPDEGWVCGGLASDQEMVFSKWDDWGCHGSQWHWTRPFDLWHSS